MDMLKMIQQMTEIEQSAKTQLTESQMTECGTPMPAPTNPGNPVTMSISLNASGKDHVDDLLQMMKAAGLEKAEPVGPGMMPMRQDMDRLGDIMRNSAMGEEDLEEYDNEPDDEYQDTAYMTKDLSGGINRRKGAYADAEDGDNAMAVDDEEKMRESIKSKLLRSLEEKKSKPDFLDVDGDGNKKEPMKKAVKDKGSKSKKGKVPPQFKKKTNEAEVQSPNHEISDIARKATGMAQMIKRKINSGENMDDRDYNQLAELGATLSRVGTNFGPKSMKDVMSHMVEYTNDRNQEGHDYPEFTVDRFKELLSMAKSTDESMVGEISRDLAKRYTKAAKMDRDFNDDDIEQSSKSGQSTSDMQRRNAKRQKGINMANKRIR